MRTPGLFRTTPFRLTLLFLALFAVGAGAFLVYIYLATAGEVNRRARAEVARETRVLMRAYQRGGVDALNKLVIEGVSSDPLYVGMLMRRDGVKISGSLSETPVVPSQAEKDWIPFVVEDRATVGRQFRLPTGELVFVGADIEDDQDYIARVARASWGAGALVLLLGLGGGLLISRRASRYMAGLTTAVAAVRGGDLQARAPLRGTHDEYDELAAGMNDMLDRIERLMGGLRHAGDAIAHDLRSPLTRLRTRLEVALLEVEAGRGDALAALEQALSDSDNLLKTFNAVLGDLAAAGGRPGARPGGVRVRGTRRRRVGAVRAALRGEGRGLRGRARARSPGPRQSRVHGPGARQPDRQCGQVHAHGRGGDGAHAAHLHRRGGVLGDRHRARRSGRRPRPHRPALRPAGEQPQ
jgi:hypothetical protein